MDAIRFFGVMVAIPLALALILWLRWRWLAERRAVEAWEAERQAERLDRWVARAPFGRVYPIDDMAKLSGHWPADEDPEAFMAAVRRGRGR